MAKRPLKYHLESFQTYLLQALLCLTMGPNPHNATNKKQPLKSQTQQLRLNMIVTILASSIFTIVSSDVFPSSVQAILLMRPSSGVPRPSCADSLQTSDRPKPSSAPPRERSRSPACCDGQTEKKRSQHRIHAG